MSHIYYQQQLKYVFSSTLIAETGTFYLQMRKRHNILVITHLFESFPKQNVLHPASTHKLNENFPVNSECADSHQNMTERVMTAGTFYCNLHKNEFNKQM